MKWCLSMLESTSCDKFATTHCEILLIAVAGVAIEAACAVAVDVTTFGIVTMTTGFTIPAGDRVTGCCIIGIWPMVFNNGELTMFPVDTWANWAWFRPEGVRTDGERINGDSTGVMLREGCIAGI